MSGQSRQPPARKGSWTLPAQSSFRSVCGTFELDLRQATIEAARG